MRWVLHRIANEHEADKKNCAESDERGETHMEIGMRITQLREERDWKKTELARRLGISHSQVSRIESGETGTLSSDILIRLAEVFDVSADYLLGLTDVRTKKNLDVVQMNISEEAAVRSYAKAEAYDDCVRTSPFPFYKVVNKSKEANKIQILDRSKFEEAGLVNIDAFYLKGVLGLEKSRKALPELYSELKWLKETADREQVDYEEIIPAEVKSEENLMLCGSGFGL